MSEDQKLNDDQEPTSEAPADDEGAAKVEATGDAQKPKQAPEEKADPEDQSEEKASETPASEPTEGAGDESPEEKTGIIDLNNPDDVNSAIEATAKESEAKGADSDNEPKQAPEETKGSEADETNSDNEKTASADSTDGENEDAKRAEATEQGCQDTELAKLDEETADRVAEMELLIEKLEGELEEAHKKRGEQVSALAKVEKSTQDLQKALVLRKQKGQKPVRTQLEKQRTLFTEGQVLKDQLNIHDQATAKIERMVNDLKAEHMSLFEPAEEECHEHTDECKDECASQVSQPIVLNRQAMRMLKKGQLRLFIPAS